MKQLGGVFEGKIASDRASITGTWTQSGMSGALVLTPVKEGAAPAAKRPQNPVKPYPYRDEDVEYENKAAGIKLAGTLTIPEGKGPFPAVVLITGSGPQDRDEALLGHRPFLVLSDYLTRKGIVVLRVDDRGVGKSGGKFDTATTADFATDTEAGIAYLKTRPEADGRKIGLIGHSEGGMIAPMVAARNRDVAFIVMMAGPGVPGDQILLEQSRLIAEAGGASHEEALKQGAQLRELLALVKADNDTAATDRKLREKLAGVPEAQAKAQIDRLNTPWFRYFPDVRPEGGAGKGEMPGAGSERGEGLQVPPKQNLPAIRAALANNKSAEIEELPGLNHLFQTAKTGSPMEYARIEETISPVALEKIASWILGIGNGNLRP